jgi:hypothetical protein
MNQTKFADLIRLGLTSTLLVVGLASCGGGGGDAGSNKYQQTTTGSGTGSGTGTNGSTSTNGGTSTTTTSQAVSLTVQLLDGSNAATTALVANNKLRVAVKLLKNGVPLSDQLVQYSLDQAADYGLLDQLTALTNASGVAAVNLSSGSATGAGRVKVIAKLDDGSTVEAGANFVSSATATQTTNLTLTSLTSDTNTVSAYGTTGFSVGVLNNGAAYGTPVTVSFSSDCGAGKAVVTTSAVTSPSGVAAGTFQDNGCAAGNASRAVVITASISTASAQRQITVQPSTAGSLRFVSVNPSDASIVLKGNGGAGRQENAQLVFRLVDQAGNGVPNTDVCFDSTTYVGGLTLDGFNNQAGKLPTNQGSATLCGSDVISQIKYVKRTDASGNVSIQIASGSVPTPVRVRARAIYPVTAASPLETFSDSLSVSTGLPLQRSFSLSVDRANIDGGNGTSGGKFDGDKAILSVRLADQFSNPVPDGTKVNFVASGGAVCTSQNGSCSTINGSCTCDFVGTERRPKDGRIVVMAYADGLEDYVDADGNNIYTSGGLDTFVDLADAFVDANKSGAYSGASVNGDVDIPIPFQTTPNYLSGDGVRGNAHIRSSTIIYMGAPTGVGDATGVIPNADLSFSTDLLSGVDSGRYVRMDPAFGCPITVPQTAFGLAVDDGYGNPLAAGTTLTAGDFTANITGKSVKPGTVLALGARAPSPSIDGPLNGGGGNVIKITPWSTTNVFGNVVSVHAVTFQGVATKCGGDAGFVIDAASPKGSAVSLRVLYEGESRAVSRFAVDVRYRDPVQVSANATNLVATLTEASYHRKYGVTTAGYVLDWGDGTSVASSAVPFAQNSHNYVSAGVKTITLTVTGSDGSVSSKSVNVTVGP